MWRMPRHTTYQPAIQILMLVTDSALPMWNVAMLKQGFLWWFSGWPPAETSPGNLEMPSTGFWCMLELESHWFQGTHMKTAIGKKYKLFCFVQLEQTKVSCWSKMPMVLFKNLFLSSQIHCSFHFNQNVKWEHKSMSEQLKNAHSTSSRPVLSLKPPLHTLQLFRCNTSHPGKGTMYFSVHSV